MDKKTLKQYRALQREIPKLKTDIQKLMDKLDDVPEVSGKVQKSGDSFPYIQGHITVKMAEPKAATEIKERIRLKELRLEQAERDRVSIEKFIAEIEDSTDRQIFELYFMEGMKQIDVADAVSLERSSISKRINSVLQLSHNSHF